MIKALRNKKTQKKIWIVLAVIIVPAFVLWGSASLLRNPKEEKSAKYKIFGRVIPASEYEDSLLAVRNLAILQLGDNFAQFQQYLNLEGQAIERLILLHEAKKRNLTVSDKEVIGYIQGFPLFQNKGQFDNRTYEYFIQYYFHTQARIFEEQTRKNLLLEKLYATVTKPVSVSDTEIKETYRKENEQISLHYLAALTADFIKDVAVSDEEMKTYFDKHSLDFKRPLSFNLEYVTLDSEAKKNELATLLSKHNDLPKAAAALSLPLKETGLFSQEEPVPGIGWSPEIINALSTLKIGEASTPLQVDKAFFVLRIKEKKEPYVPEFASVKDKVREVLAKDRASQLAKEKIGLCLKRLQEAKASNPKGLDFEKIAKELGVTYADTDFFKLGSYIENIGGSDEFFTAGRNLKDDEFSGIIAAPTGSFIVRLKAVMTIDEAKFEKEKKDFSQGLLNKKKQEAYAQFVEGLRKKALEGS